MAAPKGITEAALRAVLDADRASGLYAARSGMVNRAHYAKVLGVTRSALRPHKKVLDEYAAELNIVTTPLRHLAEMRQWLAAAYAAKKLEFDGFFLRRIEFVRLFKLNSAAFVKYSEIRELWNEYDEHARSDGYVSAAKQVKLDLLIAALAANPPLNKDRLTVNRTLIASQIGVSRKAFNGGAFRALIEEQDAELLQIATASKIDPFIHGRVYAFSDLEANWSKSFLERVGTRFKLTYSASSATYTTTAHRTLHGALSNIGTSPHASCQIVVREARETGRVASADSWEDALGHYRSDVLARVQAGELAPTSAHTSLSELRIAIEAMSLGGAVPSTSIPLVGVRNARRLGGHVRSVVEGPNHPQAASIKFATERFQEIREKYGHTVELSDASAFFGSLTSIGTITRQDDIPNAIRELLDQRLSALRTRCFQILSGCMDAHERGKSFLALAKIDCEAFERQLLDHVSRQARRISNLRATFPDPKVDPSQATLGLANLLKLISHMFDGIPPEGGTNKTGEYREFFADRYQEHGGLKTVQPFLIPPPEAVGATLTLYLIDSGANVSVGRTLEADCLERSDLAGHYRITGNKARAQGKPIIVDLPQESLAVRGISWLTTAGKRLNANATDSVDADRLFLMRIGGRVQLMTPNWYTSWFTRMAAAIPELSSFRLTPNMIRPSVLLHTSLSNEGRLLAGVAIGQHGIEQAQTYQIKHPTRLLYDANIRRFHTAFESLILSTIDDAAEKLGIPADEFQRRMDSITPSGLGTFCLDRRGRPGQQAEHCQSIDCWNDCPHMLVFAEVEAIATLQLWQSSLRSSQPEWERDRPERWDEVWLPWLCFTDVIEEKMARGPLLKVWNQAKQAASARSADPRYVAPRPW